MAGFSERRRHVLDIEKVCRFNVCIADRMAQLFVLVSIHAWTWAEFPADRKHMQSASLALRTLFCPPQCAQVFEDVPV